MGFLVEKTIGKEVSELSKSLFRLFSTLEKTANLRALVLIDCLESLLPTFSPNAISSYMT